MRYSVGLVYLLSLVAAGQERPKAVVNFVDGLRALPPEFSADLLLKVAELPGLAGHGKWRRELLEEAFQLAARAPEAYPVIGGLHTDTRAYVTSGRFGIDVMSLRLRAAKAMLGLDPSRAAAMFRETPVPVLAELTCESAQVPDLENYYEVLVAIHGKGFSARERERGEPGHLLKEVLAGLRSPSQVAPLGEALMKLDVSVAERQELMDAFGGALAAVVPSDRAFLRYESSLLGFVHRARSNRVGVTALLRGLHRYIETHLSGPRCSKSILRLEKTEQGLRSELGVAFNSLAREWTALGEDIPLIAMEQMKPERDAGMWNDFDFWKSKRSTQVLEDMRWLNHGNRNLPNDQRFWTVEERRSTEWTGRYQEFQKRIEGWQEEDETGAVDYFWMKSQALQLAARLVPPGPARELAIGRWLTHFEQGYRPGTVQNPWFGILRETLRGRPGSDSEYALAEFGRSRNPVVSAYARWAAMAAQ